MIYLVIFEHEKGENEHPHYLRMKASRLQSLRLQVEWLYTQRMSMMSRSALWWLSVVFLLSVMNSASLAFAPPPTRRRLELQNNIFPTRIWARINGDDNEIKFKDSKEKRIEDLLEIERLAAETKSQPANRIFEAISNTFWVILGLGVLLNMFGYGYVVNKDEFSIKIDTLEKKQFQEELVKTSKNR